MSDGSSEGGRCGRGRGAGQGVDPIAYVYLALMILIGSSTAPAARLAVRELPTGLVPILRFGAAGLCLLPLVLRRGGGLALARMLREDGGRLALAAAFSVPINQTFFLNATRLTTTAHVALIYAAVPLVVLILATLLGQERPVPGRLVGVIVSVLGVAVIGLDGLWRAGGPDRSTILGDLLLIGAVGSWGAYLTVNKPLIVRHGAFTALAGTFLLGAILHLPVALVTMPSWRPLGEVSASGWLALAFLVVVATVLSLGFQNLALSRLDASEVATFNNAGPVLTVTWGIWLFGEAVTPALIVGGALTLVGILRTTRTPAATPRRVRAIDIEPAGVAAS